MTGGADSDVFVINRNEGGDIITDFNGAAGDRLDLDLANSSLRTTSETGGTRIEYGNNDQFGNIQGTIILEGISKATLDANWATWVF